MDRPTAFLTADSGGSKTKILLYSLEGDLINETKSKGFGKAVDSDENIPELVALLKEFTKGYIISRVVINLGGKNTNQIEGSFKSVLKNAKISIFRESEGTVGLKLCRMFDADAVLMAGTGSIAIVPADKGIVISGGWGPNVSDKGSGYHIGLSAIRTSLEELDGTEPLSEMTKRITGLDQAPKILIANDYCNLRDSVRARLAPLDRQNIASFTRLLCECAATGDTTALDIFTRAGKNLADTVLPAAKKAKKELKYVIVTGGLVHSNSFWKESFEQRLKEHHNIEKVIYIADGINSAIKEIAMRGE